MTNIDTTTLSWGAHQAIPKTGVKAIFGARLIAPADYLNDRADLRAEDEQSKQELITWLNGADFDGGAGRGAIAGAQAWLNDGGYRQLRQDRNFMVAYEDGEGVVFVTTNASHGYVYLTAYLKVHVKPFVRKAVTA